MRLLRAYVANSFWIVGRVVLVLVVRNTLEPYENSSFEETRVSGFRVYEAKLECLVLQGFMSPFPAALHPTLPQPQAGP